MPSMHPQGQLKLSICAFLILALVAGLSYWSLQRLSDTNERVSHTFEVLDQVGSAQGTVSQAEASITEYVATGAPIYLTAYETATGHQGDSVRQVRALTADNRAQQERLDALDTLLAAKLEIDAQVAQLRGAGDVAGATAVLTSQQNSDNTVAIRGILDAMRADENSLLTARQDRAHTTGTVARVTVLLSGALAIVIATLVGFGMSRQIAGRKSAIAEMDSFFDICPDPLKVMDFEGRVLRVNPAYEDAFGYSIKDFALQPMMTTVHIADRLRAEEAYAELYSGAAAVTSFACRNVCKNGTVRATTWHAASDTARGLVFSVARDDSAQRHAEDELRELNDSLAPAVAERLVAAEERARQAEIAAREVKRGEEVLRVFVENTPTAVAMLDRDLRYLVASRQWSLDYDLNPDDSLVGRYHYDIFPDVDQRWRDIHRRCLMGATEKCEEDAFPRPDGTIDWVRWEIHPWRNANAEVGGLIILIEMITERRRAIQEQRDTTADLVQINSELEAFTYSVSHDLKEPLRTLEAFSQFLLKDYADKLDDEGKDYLSRLAMASSRMKQLIDDLLTISRIGSQGVAAEAVAVDRLVAEMVDSIRITVSEHNATVDVQPGLPEVYADPRRVGQIFLNLISNGIKFNRSEAPHVEVGFFVNDAAETVFFVKDNGIGIAPEYFEKIFVVFQRLHRREDFEGTGAGLAIVKRAVEALGGRIWVESKLGEGTTFLFTLPISSAQAAATAMRKAA